MGRKIMFSGWIKVPWLYFFLVCFFISKPSGLCQEPTLEEILGYINQKLLDNPARNRPSAGPYIHQVSVEKGSQLVIHKKIMKKEHISNDAYYFTIDKIWITDIDINRSFNECNVNSGEVVFYCLPNSDSNATIQLLSNKSFINPIGSTVQQKSINLLFDYGIGEEICNALRHLFALINSSSLATFSSNKPETNYLSREKQSNTTDMIELIRTSGNTYEIPVIINGVLAINVIFDTGASDLSLSPDVALTLYRTGTIRDSDYIGTQTYRFADGSKAKSSLFRIHKIKIGKFTIKDVQASISNSIEAPLLLGQNVLSKLGKITIDYKNHLLYITK